MSIMRMRKFFRQPLKVGKGKKSITLISPAAILYILIVATLLVGIYFSFGASQAQSRAQGGGVQKLTKNVAKVNDTNISREEYLVEMEMARRRMNMDVGLSRMRMLKTSVLDALVDRVLLMQAANKQGIRVTGQDLSMKKDQLVERTVQARSQNKKSFAKYLERQDISLEQFRDRIRESLPEDDMLKQQVKFEKLQATVQSEVKMTDKELKDSYRQVKARHILVTPDSVKPSDQDEDAGAEQAADTQDNEQQMSDEQAQNKAQKLAEDIRAKIAQGAEFSQLAKKHSADPGSAQNGGELGWFGRGQMVPEFEEAAFSLEPGQVSDVIESDYGYHIIKVEDKRSKLPEDFEKKTEQYRQQKLQSKRQKAWEEYQQNLREQATIEVIDPELKAYSLLDEGKKQEGVKYLQQAVNDQPNNITARFELARLYQDQGNLEEAATLLQEVTTSEDGARKPEAHMQLAEVLLKQKDEKAAVQSFKSASDWAQAFSQQNYFLHYQLKMKFNELDKEDLAKQEQKWIDDFMENQKEKGGFGMPAPASTQ